MTSFLYSTKLQCLPFRVKISLVTCVVHTHTEKKGKDTHTHTQVQCPYHPHVSISRAASHVLHEVPLHIQTPPPHTSKRVHERSLFVYMHIYAAHLSNKVRSLLGCSKESLRFSSVGVPLRKAYLALTRIQQHELYHRIKITERDVELLPRSRSLPAKNLIQILSLCMCV